MARVELVEGNVMVLLDEVVNELSARPPQPPGQGGSPRRGDVVGQTALRFATHVASTIVNVSRSHRAIDCWLALLRKILTLTTER